MTRADARIPQIVEAEIQGKTQIQIAEDLGVSRMQIYKDRQTPLYETLVNEFFTLYRDTIKNFLEGEEKQNRLEALKELGRMYRAGMTKHMNELCDKPNPQECELYENGCVVPSRQCEFRNILKTARYWTRRAHKENLNSGHDQYSARFSFMIHALETIFSRA